ncbi:HNH endonuclease signature motif containing protein [Actinomadura rubrisoli]|uniref:HNH endonuclease n=1 Tax=Actinomadura rubrisoli TaxID=2530368 RepID=A0A4R5CF57_9ACTN|nr:HNH endonuclease signature motif containing protein [Actinomadura rubrisoli]TDD97576.1 HNH endonuclease [Actinomadura rubrisoli]
MRLERRAPLTSTIRLARVTPLQPVSVKRRAENRERHKVVHATFGDAPLCRAPGCGRLADDIHEPLTRGRGGSVTDPSNMVPLCRTCHGLVQLGPPWAYEFGLMAHSWDGGDAA